MPMTLYLHPASIKVDASGVVDATGDTTRLHLTQGDAEPVVFLSRELAEQLRDDLLAMHALPVAENPPQADADALACETDGEPATARIVLQRALKRLASVPTYVHHVGTMLAEGLDMLETEIKEFDTYGE